MWAVRVKYMFLCVSLANEGKGVLVVSSELPELLSVCDTIAVFREGEIRGIFKNSEATEEKIVKTSTGE